MVRSSWTAAAVQPLLEHQSRRCTVDFCLTGGPTVTGLTQRAFRLNRREALIDEFDLDPGRFRQLLAEPGCSLGCPLRLTGHRQGKSHHETRDAILSGHRPETLQQLWLVTTAEGRSRVRQKAQFVADSDPNPRFSKVERDDTSQRNSRGRLSIVFGVQKTVPIRLAEDLTPVPATIISRTRAPRPPSN